MSNINITRIAKDLTSFFEGDSKNIGYFLTKVAVALIVYIIAVKLIKWFCSLLEKRLIKSALPIETRTFLTSVSKVALHILVILFIAAQLGINETSVAALVASAGVAIGLALQGGLSNLAAGAVIILAKPFVAGDYITESTHNYEGTVKKIELYYTTLATYDNRMVIIPNSVLAGNTIINTTAMAERRLEIIFGIYYESDLKQAKTIIRLILDNDEEINHKKEIEVFVEELAPDAVKIGFWAWVKSEDYFDVRWKINEKIKEAFDQGHIEICHTRLASNVRVNETKVDLHTTSSQAPHNIKEN